MNDLYFKYYGKYPINECDDAGYGNYENYKYIKKHNINNYIKFQNWEGESTGKNPQLFYTFDDGVMCLNTNIGEQVPFDYYHRKKNKDGVLYKFTGCNNCNYSYKCKAKLKEENRDHDYRYYELIPEYELLKEWLGNENCTLVWNPGGHFQDGDKRLAAAFSWCIKALELSDIAHH